MLVSFYLETCWKTLIWAHTRFSNAPQFLPLPPLGYSLHLLVGICHWDPRVLNFATRELPKSLAIDQRVATIFSDSHLSMLSLLLNWVVGKFKFVDFYFFFFEWQCILSIVLNKIFNKLISFLEIDTLILDLNYLICVPHPILNCLKTIPFMALFP